MGLFYTGKGDKGKSYICGKKIDKTCCEMETLGHLDELNSLIGLIRGLNILPKYKNEIKQVQENLFIIQANIAVLMFNKKLKVPEFPASKIKNMEKIVDDLEKNIKPEKGFIISGETASAGWFDFTRAVCRRAEREILKLAKKKKVKPEIIAYLNRLSGFMFALARYASKKSGKKEKHPSYK